MLKLWSLDVETLDFGCPETFDFEWMFVISKLWISDLETLDFGC